MACRVLLRFKQTLTLTHTLRVRDMGMGAFGVQGIVCFRFPWHAEYCLGSIWASANPHPDSTRTLCAVVVVAVVAVVVIQGCLTLPHSVGVRYMGIGALVV